MRTVSFVLGMLVLTSLTNASLGAQQSGLRFAVYGGGYSPLADLTPSGDVGFQTGFNLGGALILEINRFLAIRGDLTAVVSRERGTATGDEWRKLFSGGDLVLRLPLGNFGLSVSGGGGVVTMDEDVPDSPLSSRRAARVGAGLYYDVSPNVGFFAQGLGWIYTWDREKYPTYSERQLDAVYSLGLSYKVPF